MLRELHDKLLSKYNFQLEMRPVYYSTDNAIRFGIEPNGSHLVTEDWVQSVSTSRATKIFDAMFDNSNILVMYDHYKQESKELEFMRNSILSNYTEESFVLDEDLHNNVDSTRFLFRLVSSNINKELLIKGIMGYLSTDECTYSFTSCIYIFNLDTDMMYYLYDERGLDVASVNLDSLKPLYNNFSNWLLPEVKSDMGAELSY